MWCTTAAPDFAPLCSTPRAPPHDSRLAGLGARVGDRGGVVEDESTFWKPFPPRVKAPAKGQYETKLKSQGLHNPCRLSKRRPAQPNPTDDKFFGEKNGNWQEGGGKVIQQWLDVRLPDRALFIPPALLVRDPTEISHTSGRCRWTKYGRRQWPGPPSCEQPLPRMMKYPRHAAPEM